MSLFIFTTNGRITMGDGVVILEVTESIVESGTLHTDRDFTWYETNPGWSYFCSGLSVIAVPFYVLGKLLALPFNSAAQWPIVMLFVSFTNALLCALLVLVFYKLCLLIKPDPKAAVICALLLMLCTDIWPMSRDFMREPAAALGLIGCIYFLVAGLTSVKQSRLVQAGLCFLATVWVRIELYVLLPLIAGYLLFALRQQGREWSIRRAGTSLGLFLLPPLAAVPIFLYFNLLKFGDPFKFGFSGHSLTASPLGIGLRGLLVSPMNGLAIYSTAALFGLLGIRKLVRIDRALGWFVPAACGLILVFYSKYSVWSGFLSSGPRFLGPAIPLLMLPLVFVLDASRWTRALLAMCACWGLGLNALRVLSSHQVFCERVMRVVGYERELLTPVIFLHSPLSDYLEQIRGGLINIAWANLSEYAIPSIFLILPAAYLCVLAVSGWRIAGLFRCRGASRVRPEAKSSGRRALAAMSLLSVLPLLVLLAERTANPRGLELQLFDKHDGQFELLAAHDRQLPRADPFHNPFKQGDRSANAVVWQGYLRIPSYYYFSRVRLTTSGIAKVIIDDKSFLNLSTPEQQRSVSAEKRLDLTRGYYPLKIVHFPGQIPLFDLRWTIQDYAFLNVIGRDYLFSAEPSGLWRIVIEGEFYLLAASLLMIFFTLAYWFKLRDANSESRSAHTI